MDLKANNYKTEVINVISMLKSIKEYLKMMKRGLKKKTIELLAMKNRIHGMKIH